MSESTPASPSTSVVPVSTSTEHVTSRNIAGQFVKGRSGNLAGRTAGSRNRANLAKAFIEEALAGRMVAKAEKILDEVIRLALHGEEATQVQMMKLLLGDVLKETRKSDDGALAAATKKMAQAVQINIVHYHGEQTPAQPSPREAIDGEFTEAEEA